jgi:hypothetical protein
MIPPQCNLLFHGMLSRLPLSPNPQLNQECDRINVSRRAAIVIFVLVVKVGGKTFTELLASTDCNSVRGPAIVYRVVEEFIPRKKGCFPLLRADKVFDLGTVSIVP